MSKRFKLLPVLGSLHASDILNSYGQMELTDYLIRFATTLDPNVGEGRGIDWPKYDTATRQLVTFQDSIIVPSKLTVDDYRKDAIQLLVNLGLKYPL